MSTLRIIAEVIIERQNTTILKHTVDPILQDFQQINQINLTFKRQLSFNQGKIHK